MTKAFRIAIGSGVLAAGLAVAGAPTARAQVRVRGSFPLPHGGRISVDVAHGFPVGGYVPHGYDVYEDPYYSDYYGGYGFAYEDQWIPCERRGSRWVIVAAPVHYAHREYRTGRRYYDDRRYSRNDRRYDRRYERHDRDRDRRGDRWRRDDRRDRWDDGRDRRNRRRY